MVVKPMDAKVKRNRILQRVLTLLNSLPEKVQLPEGLGGNSGIHKFLYIALWMPME